LFKIILLQILGRIKYNLRMLPEDTAKQLDKLRAHVCSLSDNAQTLRDMLTPRQQGSAQESPHQPTHLERARILLALSQIMHALHQMHMKAAGLDPQKHFQADIHKVRTRED
jgi:hypothetical protein